MKNFLLSFLIIGILALSISVALDTYYKEYKYNNTMEQSIKELLLALYNNKALPSGKDSDNFFPIQRLTSSPRGIWQPIADLAFEKGYIAFPGEETTYGMAIITEKGIEYLKQNDLI